MKKALAIALAVMFVLSIAVPAFAQSMSHTVKEEYVEAQIDIERQAGHLCNTGAELKYTVKGSAAEFMAERAITQVAGKITVTKDDAAWVAGATPLTVTSVIELCAPAKYEYDLTRYVYRTDEVPGWQTAGVGSGIVSNPAGYNVYNWGDRYQVGDVTYGSVTAMVAAAMGGWDAYLAATADARDEAYRAIAYTYHDLTALTDQIWAVQVQSDAGFSGNLEQQWEAAYGDYEGWKTDGPLLGNTPFSSDLFLFDDDEETHKKAFGFRYDEDDYVVVELGADYVGNYFNIQQHARTSQGTLKRYIDVSSPWSHAYVSENSTVVGKADVQETFAMGNLGPGADIATDWWELF